MWEASQCDSVGWASSRAPKAGGCHFMPGHMPRLWARPLVGGIQDAADVSLSSMFLSLSSSPILPVKSIKKNLKTSKLKKKNTFCNHKSSFVCPSTSSKWLWYIHKHTHTSTHTCPPRVNQPYRPTFTMHCNGALGTFTYIQKFFDDRIGRGAAIRKEKIIVIETSIRKLFGIIHPFIQTDNGSNVVILKIGNVSLRRMLVVTYIKKLPNVVKCRKKTMITISSVIVWKQCLDWTLNTNLQ